MIKPEKSERLEYVSENKRYLWQNRMVVGSTAKGDRHSVNAGRSCEQSTHLSEFDFQ